MKLRIREARSEDLPAIRSVVTDVRAEFGFPNDSADLDADLTDIEASYSFAGGYFGVLVDEEDRIWGTVALFRVDDEACELRKMYFRPEVRGKGWGRFAMDHVLEVARSLSCRRMELETASILTAARTLYERYGFKPVEREETHAQCDAGYVLEFE